MYRNFFIRLVARWMKGHPVSNTLQARDCLYGLLKIDRVVAAENAIGVVRSKGFMIFFYYGR
jgi:hypothetical protein